MPKRSTKKKKILRAVKAGMRKQLKEQGGLDGRFRTRAVPDKKKYQRKKAKPLEEE